jgi:cobalamin biosynthetic protein CobC
MTQQTRDHGGGLDAAMAEYGGTRADWIDLSTGINPCPYPLPEFPPYCWTGLPDAKAQEALLQAARGFWAEPKAAAILAAPGVSALIARLPALASVGAVGLVKPTYNEHEAAFRAHGWTVTKGGAAQVFVHPNNPDGRLFSRAEILQNHAELTIIDESFCDTCPAQSHMDLALTPGVVILKGLGKFWGLAGVRLGFAIGLPQTIAALGDLMGPWAVSGPALHVGALALKDRGWAAQTRARLSLDAARLDNLMAKHSHQPPQGSDLFRLYHVQSPRNFQRKLAENHIWSRIFPYSDHFLRLGLPGADSDWKRLKNVLKGL